MNIDKAKSIIEQVGGNFRNIEYARDCVFLARKNRMLTISVKVKNGVGSVWVHDVENAIKFLESYK